MESRHFIKEFLSIAIPIICQYFLATSLNLIDTMMVGQLGDQSIAAVGIGNQIFFVINLFLLGIGSGVGIFVAQFLGNQNHRGVNKTIILGQCIALVVTISATVIILGFGQTIMGWFTRDRVVVDLGTSYLKTVSYTYIIMGITSVFSAASRSAGNSKLPMVASFAGVSVNTIGNYILIFGFGNIPALGVKGAALATVLARGVEWMVLVAFIYTKYEIVAVRLRDAFSISHTFIRGFLGQIGVLILKDSIWGFGATLYIAIYARMGTEAVASVNVVNSIRGLCFVLLMGISNAAIVMIGNQLGQNKSQLAYRYALAFQKLTVGASILVAVTLTVFRSHLIGLFNVSPVVRDNMNLIILVFSTFFFVEGYNMVTVLGVLRSGGDNKFCLYMDLLAVWCIGLPIAFVGAFVSKLPVYWVYGLILFQELFKFVLLLRRTISKKWINNIVEHIE